MKLKIENDLSKYIDMPTPESIRFQVVSQFIARRKELKLSRKELANRSGVSYSSIRRFEEIGKIAFDSLLALAKTIDCLADFINLFSNPRVSNLKERYDKEYK